jgi:hypothetical protein
MATLGFCRALLGDLWASVHSVKHHCLVQDGFWRPTFGGFGWTEHEPQSFSALLQLIRFLGPTEKKAPNTGLTWPWYPVWLDTCFISVSLLGPWASPFSVENLIFTSTTEETKTRDWPDLQIILHGRYWGRDTLRAMGYTEEVSTQLNSTQLKFYWLQ